MDYLRPTHRFACLGVNVRAPADALPNGKYPRLQNVRPYLDTAIVPRVGTAVINDALADLIVHTVFQLDDPTEYATQAYLRLIGAGTNLYAGTTGAFGAAIVGGFSGNPLTIVSVLPDGQPQPWAYIADTNKMRKVRTDGVVYGVGLPPPMTAPAAVLDAPAINVIDRIDSDATGWGPVGAYAGAVFEEDRVNTTVADILYDDGSTGWCSVALTIMDDNVQPGMYVSIGTFPTDEVAYVQSVKPSLSSTTVDSIIYDSGDTGFCTVQPAASVALGQLASPVAGAQGSRGSAPPTGTPSTFYLTAGWLSPRVPPSRLPPSPLTDAQRQQIIDLGTDSLITIGGELVRIVSVAVGPDGIQSFRCSTTDPHVAGDAIVGVPSFRIFLTSTRSAGDDATAVVLKNTLTPPSPAPAAMFGGITKTLAIDLSQINGRPTQPDDEIHISLKFSSLQQVTEARIYFDVDATTNDFTHNYYMYSVRPPDIAAALQETNAGDVVSLTTGRQTAVQRSQINASGSSGAATGGASRRAGARLVSIGPPTAVVVGGSGSAGGVGPGGADRIVPKDVAQDDALAGTVGTLVGGAVSRQIGGGVLQWAEIRLRVSDLIRIGADQARTLANVQAVQIIVSCSGDAPLDIYYSSLWLGGSQGPDVGTIGSPYLYCYRPLSTVTGAKGNASPAMRSGVSPRRQAVMVTGVQHPSPEVDQIEWFRMGGALPAWRSVAITPNDNPPTLTDVYADSVVISNGGLETDNFQPWPVTDKPRTGTVNAAGTAVEWVSGDKFNTSWAPGTPITIGGQTYTLYAQPSSETRMDVLENIGTLAAQPYSIIDATILGQPLPMFWGDFQGYYFGCGDVRNPGAVRWTKGNNPEVASDANWLQVTTPSEALQNGIICDRRPFVFSTDNLYELVPSSGGITDFDFQRTQCGKGLWSPWALATDGESIYFLASDGIYVTAAGAGCQSITDADLYPLFPHEGTRGFPVNGLYPPDMTRPADLRLAYANGFLYFDYIDTNGASRSMAYYPPTQSWFPDVFASGSACHSAQTGEQGGETFLGGRNGKAYFLSKDLDDGVAYSCLVRTPSDPGDDPRVTKQVGDVVVDADAVGGVGFTVQVGYDQFSRTPDAPAIVNAGVNGRRQAIVEIADGAGELARDVALEVTWDSIDQHHPGLYLWQPAWLNKGDETGLRATDWDDAGVAGAKFVQGVIIRADTGGVERQVEVQYDGGIVGPTLTINHDGEEEKAYPITGMDWTPFIAHLIRLIPIDANAWRLFNVRWVAEPAPELATHWETPPMTHGLSGFQTFRPFAFVAYTATAPATLKVVVDGQTFTYALPSTSGAYAKTQVRLRPMKGKSVVYQLTSTDGVRAYAQDIEFGVRAWGDPGPYTVVRPFGGSSVASGAQI